MRTIDAHEVFTSELGCAVGGDWSAGIVFGVSGLTLTVKDGLCRNLNHASAHTRCRLRKVSRTKGVHRERCLGVDVGTIDVGHGRCIDDPSRPKRLDEFDHGRSMAEVDGAGSQCHFKIVWSSRTLQGGSQLATCTKDENRH